MLKLLLSLFSVIILTSSLSYGFFKPEGIVTGKVLDSSTGYYLPGAVIKINGTKLGAITDKSGYFQILNVPTGIQTVSVSYIGYTDTEKQVNIEDQKNTSVTF